MTASILVRLTVLTLMALALVSVAPTSLGALRESDSRKEPVLIGVQLYSVREDCAKDLPGVLKAIAKMGYTGVEFAGYHGRTAEELKKLLDDNGLKCYGTHIQLETLLGDNLEKTVAFNKTLGNTMLIVPYLAENRRNSKQALVETAKFFTDIAKKLKPHGMTFAYHNHDFEFKPVDGEEPYYTLFDNADRSVAVQFDIGNALHGGAQAAPYIAKYPGRVLSVHVKDHSATNDKALLGEGDVQWSDVMPLLLGKAGTKYFIIEQESYAYPPLECIEKCLRNFEKMLTKYQTASRFE